MMKITTLLQIPYLRIVKIAGIIFWGRKYHPEPPAEIGLTNIDYSFTADYQNQYTFGWEEVTQIAEYKFTLIINGQIVHTELTKNNELKIALPLDYNSEVKFKIQSIYENGGESETIEDSFIFLKTVAAVEVVYCRENQIPDVSEICKTEKDYVKFDPESARKYCNGIARLANYYFSKEDFCECATNGFESENFINCLKAKKKIVCNY